MLFDFIFAQHVSVFQSTDPVGIMTLNENLKKCRHTLKVGNVHMLLCFVLMSMRSSIPHVLR